MYWIVGLAGLVGILLFVPLSAVIRIRWDGEVRAEFCLRFLLLPLWRWRLSLSPDSGLDSRIRIALLPEKRTLPIRRRREEDKTRKKSSPLRLDYRIRSVRLALTIPWDEGWETLRRAYLLRQTLDGLSFLLEERFGAKSDFTLTLAPPRTDANFAAYALIHSQLYKTLLNTLRKAVASHGTPH